MINFSPNMLKTFKTCPKKYFYKYVENISMPQPASFFEKGKKIHALANYYLRGADITNMLNELTDDEKLIWQRLLANEFFQKTYVNSEYNLSAKIGDYWVGGRLDALMKDGENYYILDYKTGTIPQNPEYDFQTMVYLLCADKKIKNYASLTFVYIDLRNDKNCEIKFTSEFKAKYENYITEICSQIENAQFPERIEHSKSCEFCEYKKICI